jgi:hypothetical protein
MKQWLSLERACGNTISKQDLMAEYMARLQATANELRNKASAKDITALQRAELLRDSTDREERKTKLLENYDIGRQILSDLLDGLMLSIWPLSW